MPRIVPCKNGPLYAENMPELKDEAGNILEGKGESYSLCRCGQSKNKPFCDGSHAKAGFESKNHVEETRNDPIEYKGMVEGDEVVISYTPVLCGSYEACIHNAPGAFQHGRDPWIEPEKDSKDNIAKALKRCPSGAISVSVNGSALSHLDTDEVEIHVMEDGPYLVRNVDLHNEFTGERADTQKYILCRCGHSKNKPFCDASHNNVGWKGKARDRKD